jgi:energy-coupling factor transporter ATP-binding protein EcfA2
MTEALRYEGMTFTYPGSHSPALEDVTVGVPEGAFALAVG